jgi:hypothetical protein
LIVEIQLVLVSQPLPKHKKSRKINSFAASDERGGRLQKLIKHIHYTRLAMLLQGQKT